MSVELQMTNHTKLPMENKMAQLHSCLQRVFDKDTIIISTITCDDLGYKTPNFTTSGIFHLHGFATIREERLPWSIILKVIKSDSSEKEEPQHHNYWRREALIFESNLLDELPDCIQAPKCFLVEKQQQDGTIWLWMERVEGQYAHSQDQFNFIARQVGRFNGTYLMGRALPQQEWICRGWLKSWITASRMYAPHPEAYLQHLNSEHERNIWAWFQSFNKQVENNLSTLGRLPRVLAHQDLSQMNMLVVHNANSDRLVLIDWQFMSISGVGEDLAKMFGVNMSLGIIPPDRYKAFQASLFDAYIAGLRDRGWQGDDRLARYGYCLGTALRSIWEVPSYISLVARLESDPSNEELQERVTRFEQIIHVHMDMAQEADTLRALVTLPEVGSGESVHL